MQGNNVFYHRKIKRNYFVIFTKFCKHHIKIEAQKIVNLLNSPDNEYSRFATKKWYVIDSKSKGVYSKDNPIKFLTKLIESSLCDYSDAYVLVTGHIAVTGTIAAEDDDPVKIMNHLLQLHKLHLKIVHHFKDCRTEINDTFVDYVDFINSTMAMYNLIEYSVNYSDNSGSL